MSPTRRIRVLVVEDSLTVRRHLVEVLSADPDLEVVAECADGRAGVEACATLRPDVVTLDMMMPSMDGLEATERIMAFSPTPILIVSASTNRGELFKSLDALAAGAVDVLDKPGGDVDVGEGWDARLVARVKLVSRIAVITHPRARMPDYDRARRSPAAARQPAGRPPRLVAIGASTGGPGAVQRILAALPASFPLPILVIIHMGKPFGVALAEWLDGSCALEVAVARGGEPLAGGGGRVLLAPSDRHLVVAGGAVMVSDAPERHYCRPSVDVLFESVATDCGRDAIAALLTGMGRDGAEGMLAIRSAGGATIAQDEASSVVYGMPREAMRIGAVQRELPLDAIARELEDLAARPMREAR